MQLATYMAAPRGAYVLRFPKHVFILLVPFKGAHNELNC